MNTDKNNTQLPQSSVMQSVIFRNELRIGNYIQDYYKTKVLIVENVDSTLNYKEINNVHSSNHITNLKQIEICREWLIKLGYEQKGSFYRFKNSRFAEVIIHDEGIEVCVHSVALKHIKYIHQLQNLYFSLTATELTVA